MLRKFQKLKGSYVRCDEAFGPIPAGTRAYCLRDVAPVNESDSGVFHIFVETPIMGVNEFKLPTMAKNNFSVL